jgi:ABC-2 type transport system ATP-binding protein
LRVKVLEQSSLEASVSIITTSGLTKRFQRKQKSPGVRGSVRNLFKANWEELVAVQGIDLEVKEGERLAFIGPNGAGKSTTIKMFVGILHPTSGDARVMGKVPWRERAQLSRDIGVVFGQKSQLWYHLPPEDSFDLLAEIYDIEQGAYRARLGRLVDMFELGSLLQTPVRQQSLGQRMRCEIAASLLHNPAVIFLDEPTIGLDVVVKQRIRDLILELNRQDGVTVFLTSHDAGDMEVLCSRAVVINHGRIIYDGKVSTLKREYIRSKTISLKLRDSWRGFSMDGVRVLKQKGYGVKLEVDTFISPIDKVVDFLLAEYSVADISVDDPPMEKVIAAIYGHTPSDS